MRWLKRTRVYMYPGLAASSGTGGASVSGGKIAGASDHDAPPRSPAATAPIYWGYF